MEGKRRRGSPSPLLPCKRKSPKSTSNESLSRFAAARPATCPGVKKAEEEAAAAAKEDQEIVGKRAIRFHYPSLAATSMLPVTHKFTSSSRRYYPAALSCVRARCTGRKNRRSGNARRRRRSRWKGKGSGDGARGPGLLISFYQPLSVTLISSFARASFINELGIFARPGYRHNQGMISLV